MGDVAEVEKVKCGIMMPIAPQKFGAFEYSKDYWESMLLFLKDAIIEAGYSPIPVWSDDLNSTVTSRIVKNIAELPLAVCVVSSFNPNVMIELGMRLNAAKPVLVLLDENTASAPFDIKDLEYYQYPTRPLYAQYPAIKRVLAEFLKKMAQPGYKNFKDNFSTTVAVASETGEMKRSLEKISDGVASLKNDLSGLLRTRQEFLYPGPEYLGPTGPSPVFGCDIPWTECDVANSGVEK